MCFEPRVPECGKRAPSVAEAPRTAEVGSSLYRLPERRGAAVEHIFPVAVKLGEYHGGIFFGVGCRQRVKTEDRGGERSGYEPFPAVDGDCFERT